MRTHRRRLLASISTLFMCACFAVAGIFVFRVVHPPSSRSGFPQAPRDLVVTLPQIASGFVTLEGAVDGPSPTSLTACVYAESRDGTSLLLGRSDIRDQHFLLRVPRGKLNYSLEIAATQGQPLLQRSLRALDSYEHVVLPPLAMTPATATIACDGGLFSYIPVVGRRMKPDRATPPCASLVLEGVRPGKHWVACAGGMWSFMLASGENHQITIPTLSPRDISLSLPTPWPPADFLYVIPRPKGTDAAALDPIPQFMWSGGQRLAVNCFRAVHPQCDVHVVAGAKPDESRLYLSAWGRLRPADAMLTSTFAVAHVLTLSRQASAIVHVGVRVESVAGCASTAPPLRTDFPIRPACDTCAVVLMLTGDITCRWVIDNGLILDPVLTSSVPSWYRITNVIHTSDGSSQGG